MGTMRGGMGMGMRAERSPRGGGTRAGTDQPKKKKGMTAESIAKMEQEMVMLESGMKAITESIFGRYLKV